MVFGLSIMISLYFMRNILQHSKKIISNNFSEMAESGICRCKKLYRKRDQTKIMAALDEIDPYINITTREVLVKRHPNLPIELILASPACTLLPKFTR